MKKTFGPLLILLCLSNSYAAPSKNQCFSTKEYVTTYNYLKSKKEFKLPEAQNQKIAEKVSNGCNYASRRFIKVTNLLTKVGFNSRQSLQTAIRFALSTPSKTESFINIFKRSFVKDNLNLDLNTSIKIALSLSIDHDGDRKKVNFDFDRLVEFCTRKDDLDLPAVKCANVAARITKLGKDFKEPTSISFIKLFDFLRSRKGPSLATYDALKISEDLMAYGPISTKNFINAYKFAVSRNGLGLDVKKAVDFGIRMGKKSKPAEIKKPN